MRSTRNIIEEYRKADVEKRLDLFLECPSLRTRFAEIDQSEIADESLNISDRCIPPVSGLVI